MTKDKNKDGKLTGHDTRLTAYACSCECLIGVMRINEHHMSNSNAMCTAADISFCLVGGTGLTGRLRSRMWKDQTHQQLETSICAKIPKTTKCGGGSADWSLFLPQFSAFLVAVSCVACGLNIGGVFGVPSCIFRQSVGSILGAPPTRTNK